ncbi:MAG TPA: DUF1800 family protein, partial [Pyrinomonadaceae bacterium]|nr:DUF1800 family protein [Pyrinomonadaceae bacterium]
MRIRALAFRKGVALVGFAGLLICCGAATSVFAAPAIPPSLFTVSSSSTRAVALETVSMTAEPFSLNSEANFSPSDSRTRITLFCMNLDFLAGEPASALSADAQDAAGTIYPLRVEYVGTVPTFDGVYMVVVRLNDSMPANLGDVLVRLNLHGVASNRARVAIGQIGGGPADDSAPNPAPATPPGAATPLTLAQFQAQYNNPAFASDNDLRRFLEQSSWGQRGDDADFTHLKAIGIPAYISEQFNTAPQFVDSATDPKFALSSDYPFQPSYPQFAAASCDATCTRDFYTMYQVQKQFMLNALTQNDQLRQRVGFAFHKFIVVGSQQLNSNQPFWYAPYLQTIDRNSFGNFRNMLMEVTLNPGMGEYLNMRGNSVVSLTNPTPNENYAREIMQLFSIGVDMLNQDGTPILDAQGNRVASYDQTTITNLARVFTGWDLDTNKVSPFDGTQTSLNYQDPMVPSNNRARYDTNQKTLLVDIRSPNPVVIPACTNCTNNTANTQAYAIQTLPLAIDNLFFHPNTGPYLCTQMIHQLVTSNPSPAYVGRCSAAFANNGSGVRGDMKAVITSILLDPEARGDVKTDPNYGHLREPVLLMTHLLRAFNATDSSKTDGVLVSNSPQNFSNALGQNVFNPPTVFSYFPADFNLPGTNLVGPEFGILDTSSTYARSNFVNTLFLTNGGNGIPVSAPNRPQGTQISFASFQAMSTTPQQLVDALNARLMHGT